MSDTGYPLTVEVDAQGRIIAPTGVEIPEAASLNFDAANAVVWQDPVTGVVREYIQGELFALGQHVLVLVSQADADDYSQLLLFSRAGAASLVAQVFDSTHGLDSTTVFDSAGESNFVQLRNLQKAVGTWGVFTGAGVIAGGSGDFTVTRLSAGKYQVNVAGATGLIGVANVAQAGVNGYLTCSQIAGDTIEIDFVNTGGTPTDANIAFVAYHN